MTNTVSSDTKQHHNLSAQRRIFEILQVGRAGDFVGRIFHIFIIGLIVLNVIAVMLETVEEFARAYSQLLWRFEVFSVVIFTLEYVLRVWSCTVDARFARPLLGRLRFMCTPMALIDLVAIVPFYLPMALPIDLRFLRILRFFRIFRIAKLNRYSRSLQRLAGVLHDKKEDLIVTAFVLVIVMVVVSSLMYLVENHAQPNTFSSIPATMWWAIITLTTVGYGDIYPVTPLGKLLGAIIAVLGVGMVALPAGMLASGFAESLSRDKHPKACPHCGKPLG